MAIQNVYVPVMGAVRSDPLDILDAGHCFGEILYFEDTKAKRITTISSITLLTVIEIKASALKKASDACQKQFNQAFLRILIDRLDSANSRLSTRG